MTETKTPDPGCPHCGGTGFTLTMDDCTCYRDIDVAAAEMAAKANEEMILAAEAGLPPFALPPFAPAGLPPLPYGPTPFDPAGFRVPIVVPPTSTGGASESQMAFLARLVAERNPVDVHALIGLLDLSKLTKASASRVLDALVLIPKDPTKQPVRPNKYAGQCTTCSAPVPEMAGRIEKIDGYWKTFHLDGKCPDGADLAALLADRVTEPGVYKQGEALYRVRKGRYDKTVMWAEEIHMSKTTVRFSRAGRATFLRASERLSWKEAHALGAAFNACVNCGKHLDDKRSVVAGYGKTCSDNNGWRYPSLKEAEAVLAGLATWGDD